MANKQLIGIDMGATNLRAGLVEDGELRQIETVAIDHSGKVNAIVDQIVDCIKNVRMSNTKSIGIGVPSVVDVEKGIVYDVVNIPSWDEVHLKTILEAQFDLPVYINNDANCFAVGEKYYGKAQGFDDVVGVTIGSGMGSGVILDGKLYLGANCGAGEIGNIAYKDTIMEHYTSGQFFERTYDTRGTEMYERARKGDPQARNAYKRFGEHLGVAMKTIMHMYDPEIIILGGSVGQAYELFEKSMMQELADFCYPRSLERLRIDISHQEHIAILGAAALALDGQVQ